jgi:hypothetical protein
MNSTPNRNGGGDPGQSDPERAPGGRDARSANAPTITGSRSSESKARDGEGSEAVRLADWTSLHLDLLARDRGLKRMAASLYEVDVVG